MKEFRSGVFQVVIGPIVDPAPDLVRRYPASASFSDRRKAQFSTGRLYAERAIRNIGCPSIGVEIGVDRAPIWPDGICGSISHTDSLCLAIVADASVVRAIGIDIEISGAVTADLVSLVCGLGESECSSDPTLIFSAKEAYYKAWYPLTGTFLDFSDLRVRTLPGSRVTVSLIGKKAGPEFLQQLSGYHGRIGSHVIVGLEQSMGSTPEEGGGDALADVFAALQSIQS